MALWIFLMAFLIFASLAGTFFLIRCVRKFGFVAKLGHGKKAAEWAISAALVLIPTAVIWLVFGYMNAIIVLLHAVVFSLLSELVFFIIRKARKKAFKRRYSGIAAIAVTVIYLSVGAFSAYHVSRTARTVKTEKNVGDLRVVLIADAHVGTTFDGDGFAEHMKTIEAENPDIIVVSGDFVDEDSTEEDMIISCRALGETKTKYGVYFVFGNHDKGLYSNGERGYSGDDLAAELEKNGVTVLRDETVTVADSFYIIGRNDASDELDFGGSRKSMAELTRGLDPNKFSIVLDHQPRDYAAQAAADVDLVLSGHTHGGQLIPLMQLSNLFGLGGNDRVYGQETRDGTTFIVTSGISDWAIKFKTGCFSEYVVIDIEEN